MTGFEELVVPLSGADWWTTPASPLVPRFKVSDGPAGVRGEQFTGGPPSVSFPCGAALGATWDVDLLERVGAALGEETRAKGAHVLLGPTVNLQRDPLAGRHFECYSEDPVLTAHLASAYVRGVQSRGVAACVKHLVGNDAETDRFEISSDIDPRTLREVSLLPFEHALRGAGAWTTMAAYNRLNGIHCSEHAWLLGTVLRGEWRWDGVVVSDWFGTRSTVASAVAGLDLEMPGPALHWGPKLVAALESGEVPVGTVEAKVARLARLAERVEADASPPGPDGPGGALGAVALAREAAAAGAVLLRNEPVDDGAPVLPFDPATVERLAVIGPSAVREIFQGGGSARVTPTQVVTLADALEARFDEVEVVEGLRATRGTPPLDGRRLRRADGAPGIDVEVVGSDGTVGVRLAPRGFDVMVDTTPWEGVGPGWAARATADYHPARSGPHRFKVRTNAEVALTVDGTAIDPAGGVVDLDADRPVPIVLEATPRADTVARLVAELRCDPPLEGDLDAAVAAARSADAAVVVVGLDGEWETEGRDRSSFRLPGDQDDLVRAVLAVQSRTVVVVLAGSPVDVATIASAPALLWGWYPGQQGGEGLADVLVGDADPGGRLPCTFPATLAQSPAHHLPAEPGRVPYPESVLAGHRWYDANEHEPAFCFGHGLSYTRISIGTPALVPSPVPDGRTVVEVPVRNDGDRAGSEVVQLYVEPPDGPALRPPTELRAFAKVLLRPGEEAVARLEVGLRDLARWDEDRAAWVVDPGVYGIGVGRSSRRIEQRLRVRVDEPWSAPAAWWPDVDA